MSARFSYLQNKASEAQVAEHLLLCDSGFKPALSSRVEIGDYAKKIINNAMRFEAWKGRDLVGLAAMYCNDPKSPVAYITSVSVLNEWTGIGIAGVLLNKCIEYAKANAIWRIDLEVAEDNEPALRLYRKYGFIAGETRGAFTSMSLNLNSGNSNEQQA